MNTESHQILSDMIRLARADEKLSDLEYQFIHAIAQRLYLSNEEVAVLIEQPLEATVFKTDLDRITQFHRLLLLMHVDQKIHDAEIGALRNFGLRSGIREEAIDQILTEAQRHENFMIPTEKIVAIFKSFYN